MKTENPFTYLPSLSSVLTQNLAVSFKRDVSFLMCWDRTECQDEFFSRYEIDTE